MKRAFFYKLIQLLAPILAVVVGAIVLMGQQRRLNALKMEHDKVQKDVGSVQLQLKLAATQQEGKRHPTELAGQQEQSQFIDLLRKCALETGTEIVRWSNTAVNDKTTPTPTPAPANGTAPAGRKLPDGVLQITSEVEVKGQYPKVRNFLYKLQLNPRLLTVYKARWSRDSKYPNTTAQFTLSRYVHLPSNAILASVPPAATSPMIEADHKHSDADHAQEKAQDAHDHHHEGEKH